MTSDETRMREALECLCAEDDLAEKVMERAAAPGRRARHGGPLPLVAVVSVCVTALLATGGVAYAVVASGFFQRAFGDHGLGERSEWGFTTDGGTWIEYSREFPTEASEEVVEDLEAAVMEVGLSVEGNGYTLTIEDMVVDENGSGAVTLTLENPDGLGLSEDGVGISGGRGELWFTGVEGLDSIQMRFGEGTWRFPNSRCFYERDSLSETSVRATMYFDAFGGLDEVLSGVCWGLTWHVGEFGETENFEVATDWFMPTRVVDAREFSGEGARASLSPLSVTYEIEERGEGHEFVTDCVSLQMRDGSELVVIDAADGAVNTYTDTMHDDMFTSSHTLTQLVDVGEVESVLVRGHLCEGAEEETVELTLVPAT